MYGLNLGFEGSGRDTEEERIREDRLTLDKVHFCTELHTHKLHALVLLNSFWWSRIK